MVADAAGPGPQGGRDRAVADAGRRRVNTQTHGTVAETRQWWLSRGSRGTNPETVSAVVPYVRVWVAEIAPGSRRQAGLAFPKTGRSPKTDRRPKPG